MWLGVYKYSYALTIEAIREEARCVVNTLNKRKCPLGVWLDIEDQAQLKLSKEMIVAMVKAFREVIEKAGYSFGIYTGSYVFKSILNGSTWDCPFWLAAYPYDDTGVIVERLRPNLGEKGWQYSSKYKLNGGNTDISTFDKTFIDSLVGNNKSTTSTHVTSSKPSKSQCINALISTASAELGYLEKKSNAQLDDKTANAGSNNYTKYWRDIKPEFQAQAWCACFVSWCFMKTFGKDTATKLLLHWPFVYCPTLGSLATKYANPEVGDVVLFYKNGQFGHTGIVVSVNGD